MNEVRDHLPNAFFALMWAWVIAGVVVVVFPTEAEAVVSFLGDVLGGFVEFISYLPPFWLFR